MKLADKLRWNFFELGSVASKPAISIQMDTRSTLVLVFWRSLMGFAAPQQDAS